MPVAKGHPLSLSHAFKPTLSQPMRFPLFYCCLLAVSVFACRENPSEASGEVDVAAVTFRHTDNVLRIAQRAEPVTLNPLLAFDPASRYVREMIFQTLNSRDPETMESVPLLAGLPDIRQEANGGASYSFLIDEAATWPNGMPVTAADVIFSLKVVLNPLVPAGPYRSYYDMVDNVITTPSNAKRFRVTTRRPYLLAEESLASLPIYPEYAYDPEGLLRSVRLQDLTDPAKAQRLADQGGALKAFAEQFTAPALGRDPQKVIGSGPYALVSWEDGQQITLQRRPDYWAADRESSWLVARPAEIAFTFIAEEATMVNALRDEQVDVALGLGVDQFQKLRDDAYLTERYDFATVPSLSYFGLLFNQQHPLLRDVKTRRALALLTDVDALINQLLPGLAERVNGPVLPSKTYYNDRLPILEYDPDTAIELLAEAGWGDSDGDGILDQLIDGKQEPFRFTFLCPASRTSEEIATLFQDWLSDVGIEMTIDRQDRRALGENLNKGNFAMTILGQGFNPTPDEFTQVWASSSVPPNGTNRSGFSDSEADGLIRKIRTTLSAEERDPLYRRFQEILYDNQPMIFLFSPLDRLVVSHRFDFTPKSVRPNLNFNDLQQQTWNRTVKE